MKYLPLILFVPAAIIAWAAIVANAKEKDTNLTPSKAVLVFICGILILMPISAWRTFLGWLSHMLFHSN